MERLSDSAIEVNDIEVYANCSYSCYMNLANTLNRLAAYENAGLEPEEIVKLKKRNCQKQAELMINKEDIKIGAVTFRAGTRVHKCPACKVFVRMSMKYCTQCGQALKY